MDQSWIELFQMGKHGAHVWSSYFIVWLLMVVCVTLPVIQEKKIRKIILKQIEREKKENERG